MDDYLIEPFDDFIKLFERIGVPYALIGGIAVGAHGIPRPTHDLDFTISIERTRLPELFSAARELGYSVSDDYASGWVDSVAGMPLVRVRQWVIGKAIDIDLFLVESRFQESVIARRMKLDVEGRPAWVATPEDLILLKVVAGRPRDIGDIWDIVLGQGKLDDEYMRKWAVELNVLPLLEKTLAEARA
ncbi:MAG: nucleotidyltransferase [Planctomycetes bacterium]|nr:nucleotidyltransferase [Planctomycetota bacterium]